MNEKISVVIATYNGENFIEKELDTIRNQSLSADQVLIGDDCSNDKTIDIIRNYINKYDLKSWELIENEKNIGLSKNFFNLLSLASGDYIFIADQDDEWEYKKIENMIEFMKNDDNILCLTSSFDIINSDSINIKAPKNLNNIFYIDDGTSYDIDLNDLIGHSLLRGCMMCIRRSLIDIISNTNMKEYLSTDLLCHDWCLSITACIFGKCTQLNQILTHYRIHNSNTSLENLDRIHMHRKIKRRINGLEKSILAHNELISNKTFSQKLTTQTRFKISEHISFENYRVAFLKKPSIKKYLKLILNFNSYRCYYMSKKKGIIVLLGDLIYVVEEKYSKRKHRTQRDRK